MKKPIHQRSEEEMLKDFPLRGHTPGWFFRVTEISNSSYLVEGSDQWGRSVSRQGGDPEVLLAECEEDAAQISQDREDR